MKNVEHADGQLSAFLRYLLLVLPRGFAVYFERCSSPLRSLRVHAQHAASHVEYPAGFGTCLSQWLWLHPAKWILSGYDKVGVIVPVHDWTCCSTRDEVRGYHPQGFATSVAVVLATVLSIFIWNAQVDGWFVIRNSHGHDSSPLYSNTHPQKDTTLTHLRNQVDVDKVCLVVGTLAFWWETLVAFKRAWCKIYSSWNISRVRYKETTSVCYVTFQTTQDSVRRENNGTQFAKRCLRFQCTTI
jgi:hypothetical protein